MDDKQMLKAAIQDGAASAMGQDRLRNLDNPVMSSGSSDPLPPMKLTSEERALVSNWRHRNFHNILDMLVFVMRLEKLERAYEKNIDANTKE